MKRGYATGIFSFLLLTLLVLGVVAGCSSSPATTTSPTPGGAGGGALVINDSIVSVRIESVSPRGNGITDLSVTVISTENVSDKVNPVADKVGQKIDVWTDEDVSGFKAGDMVNGRIMYAGDAVIGITLRLYDIARK